MNKVISFEDDKMLIEFAHITFEYLNGKVNDIPAKLNIRTNFNKSLLANNIFNIVNLYLWNIEEYCNKDITKIKQSIVFNIVHELSHIGQDIDYIKYNSDDNYKLLKENENNCYAYTYINLNLINIDHHLGVQFYPNDIYGKCKHYTNYYTYKRYNQADYYKHCMKTLLSNDINELVSEYIDTVFNSKKSSIIINEIYIMGITNDSLDINTHYLESIMDKYNNTNRSISQSTITNIADGTVILLTELNMHHCFDFNC